MLINGILVTEKDVACRFDGCVHSAVGEYSTPNGCACYPEDRKQDLCVQHAITAEPLGEMILTRIFNPQLYEELQQCK